MIRFFISNEANEIVCLPVNPENLAIKTQGNNATMDIINLGEISILRQPKLKELEIASFFPISSGAPYIVGVGEFKNPDAYIKFFGDIMVSKKPCRLVVTDTKINMLMSIDSFDYVYQAQTEDIAYQLKLKEYLPYSSKVVELVIQTPITTIEAPVVPTPTVATPTTSPTIPRPSTGFAVGDTVSAWGKYFATAKGTGSSGNFASGFQGKISIINGDYNNPYRYHITTLSGGARGWVSADQLAGS